MPPNAASDPRAKHYARLIREAKKAMRHAHAPISDFKVGAALLFGADTIVHGCNVEFDALGHTLCAERTAVVSAVAQNRRHPKAIAVIAHTADGLPVSPCGACRQVLYEFDPKAQLVIVLATTSGDGVRICTTADLLPDAFTLRAARAGVGARRKRTGSSTSKS